MERTYKTIADDYLGVRDIQIESFETQDGIKHVASFITTCDKTKACVSQEDAKEDAIKALIKMCYIKKDYDERKQREVL